MDYSGNLVFSDLGHIFLMEFYLNDMFQIDFLNQNLYNQNFDDF